MVLFDTNEGLRYNEGSLKRNYRSVKTMRKENKERKLIERVASLLLVMVLILSCAMPTSASANDNKVIAKGEETVAPLAKESAKSTAKITATPTVTPSATPAGTITPKPSKAAKNTTTTKATLSVTPTVAPKTTVAPTKAATPEVTPIVTPSVTPTPTPTPTVALPRRTRDAGNGNFNTFVNLSKTTLTDEDTSTVIKNGDTIFFDDHLQLEYDFKIGESVGAGIEVGSTTKYNIALPQGLLWNGNGNMILKAKDDVDQQDYEFATLYWNDGSGAGETGAYIIFHGDWWDEHDYLEGGNIELPCILDKGTIGEAEKYAIPISGSETIEVFIGDNQKAAHDYKKAGTYQDNKIVWTITYDVGNLEAGENVTLVDSFSVGGQEYVAGSFKVDGVPAAVTPESADGTTTIKYEIVTPTVGDKIIFTYETILSDSSFDEHLGEASTVSNTVKMQDADAEVLGEEQTASVTIPAADKKWLTKVGELQPNGRAIDWSITINTNDRRLRNLTMFDDIPAGLILDTSTLAINGTVVTASDYTTTTGAGGITHLEVTGFPLVGGSYAQEYTITYATNVDNAYFETTTDMGDLSFQNKAWLEFEWYKGSGTGWEPFEPPTITAPTAVNTNIILKEAVKYDASTHKITWNVTLNPYGVDIDHGDVVDTLSDFGQKYAGGFTMITDPTPGLITEGVGNIDGADEVEFLVGKIGTDTYKFKFDTYVVKPEDWGSNKTTRYNNTAVFNAQVIPEGGGLSHLVEDNASAHINYVSRVGAKAGHGYDVNTQIITWQVTVNQNNMPMTGIVIEDLLEDYLTYETGSYTGPGTIATDGQKITFNLGDLTSQTIFTFQTKVDVDACAAFTANKSVSIPNHMTMKHDDFEPVNFSGSQSIHNEAVKKGASLDVEDSDYINYTVALNVNGLDLSGVDLTDVLPNGLSLDIDSVKLYKATVNAAGTFAEGEEITSFDWKYNSDDNSFAVTMPGDSRYILKYGCIVDDRSASPFVNTANFDGAIFGGDAGTGTHSINSGGGGGGGGGSKSAALKIVKTDSLRPTKGLAGVTFKLLTELNGETIVFKEGQTDANGEVEFKGLKRSPRTYTIEEVPYTGYSDPMVVDNGDKTALADYEVEIPSTEREMTLSIVNTPVTADLSFTKLNDLGDKLEGVVFTLTETDVVAPATPFTETATSDADGAVAFDNIPFGKYELEETATIQYHILDSQKYTVTIATDGTVTMEDDQGTTVTGDPFINNIERGTIEIQVYDDDTKDPIDDTTFEIYNSDGDLVATETPDATGKLTFMNLPMGDTYTIRERQPAGSEYKPSPDITVTLDTTSDEVEWPKDPPHEVIYEFTSGTPGKELPQEIKDLTPPRETRQYKGDEVTSPTPATTVVEVADGTWEFKSWDRDEVTITNEDEDVTGTWEFTPKYDVTYKFESETKGKKLPTEVTDLLPEANTRNLDGTKVESPTPEKTSVKVTDGTWDFVAWEETEVTIAGKNAEVTGTWKFTGDFDVTYEFVSGTKGQKLPKEVTDLLPQNRTGIADGSGVNVSETPAIGTEVKVKGGTWTFMEWDQTKLTIEGANGKFVGTWVFTADGEAKPKPKTQPKQTIKPNSLAPKTRLTGAKTGDTTNFLLYGGLGAVAVAAMAAAVVVKKKRK